MEHLALEVFETRANLLGGFLNVTHGVSATRYPQSFATRIKRSL